MGRLFGGLLSWAASGLWWLFDRMYGDQLFAWVRPLIPEWMFGQSADSLIGAVVSFGPLLLLFALGVYFFRTEYSATKGATVITMSQSDQKGLGGNVYITSNNQSGGVTAQNVNINARAQRVMGDNLKIGLLGQIPKDKPIVVWSLMGNEEALRYATEIFNFMKISGYNLIGNAPFSQIWTAPLYGVEVKFDPDKTHISVGFFDGTEQPRHNLP